MKDMQISMSAKNEEQQDQLQLLKDQNEAKTAQIALMNTQLED